MRLENTEENELELVGTAEELEALGDMLKMKAKLGDQFQATYTGLGNKLHIIRVNDVFASQNVQQVLEHISTQIQSALCNLYTEAELDDPAQMEEYVASHVRNSNREFVCFRKEGGKVFPSNLYTALLLKGIRMYEPWKDEYTDESGTVYRLGEEPGILLVAPVQPLRYITCNLVLSREGHLVKDIEEERP